MYLAPFDVQGSLAHIHMLESIGLLTKDELEYSIKGTKKYLQGNMKKVTLSLKMV